MKNKPPFPAKREVKVKDLGTWFREEDARKKRIPFRDSELPSQHLLVTMINPISKSKTKVGFIEGNTSQKKLNVAGSNNHKSGSANPSNSRPPISKPTLARPRTEVEDEVDESREISYQIRGKSNYFLMVERLIIKGEQLESPKAASRASGFVVVELKDYTGMHVSRWKASEQGTYQKSCRGIHISLWWVDRHQESLEKCSRPC